jgi:hypothetical protein
VVDSYSHAQTIVKEAASLPEQIADSLFIVLLQVVNPHVRINVRVDRTTHALPGHPSLQAIPKELQPGGLLGAEMAILVNNLCNIWCDEINWIESVMKFSISKSLCRVNAEACDSGLKVRGGLAPRGQEGQGA